MEESIFSDSALLQPLTELSSVTLSFYSFLQTIILDKVFFTYSPQAMSYPHSEYEDD